MQVATEGTTLYFEAFGVRVELFAGNQWNEYLMVGGTMVEAHFNNVATATFVTRYFHLDHLGSVAILTDENGVAVDTRRLSRS